MRYLTTGEVASRCQVSVGTVKNWIEAGKLEAFRTPGRHFRIRASELRRFQAAFGFGAEGKSAGLATLGRRITSLLDGDAASAEVPVSRSRRASPRRARPAHPAKSARRARP